MPPGSQRSALIVEDDADFRDILIHVIGPWQLEILTTNSAAEALSMVSQRTFDLYLIDLKLSDTDASGLLAYLLSMGETLSSRIVVVTAYPLVASAITTAEVVDKMMLGSLGPHLLRILGPAEPVLEEV